MIVRLLICSTFALYATEAHARGGQAGNGAVALTVLLGLVLAVPYLMGKFSKRRKRP